MSFSYNPHRINPPDEPEPEAVCESCGAYMYPSDGDWVFMAEGEILCLDCPKDRYRYHIDETY